MLKSGHRVEPLTPSEQQKQDDHFKINAKSIRLQPGGSFFTSHFTKYADKIYDFEFRPTDVLIMTFPKCGTTWMQEIVWTMMKNQNFDNPDASLSVNTRCPFLEFDLLFENLHETPFKPGSCTYDLFTQLHPEKDPKDGIFLQFAEHAKEPRIMKTHFPFSLLSPKLIDTCKVIFIAREPKDVAVSYLHHSRWLKTHNFVGTDDDFFDHFINDTLFYSPFWGMLKEAWDLRSHPNLHFMYFEDLKNDPTKEKFTLQKFLGLNLTNKQIEKIADYTHFKAMSDRKTQVIGINTEAEAKSFVNIDVQQNHGGFFRKGEIGDGKKNLDAKQCKKIDEWARKHMESFGPDFKYAKDLF